MKKKYLFLASVLVILPLLGYYLNFKNTELSKDTELWGNFGDFLNGIYTPLIALVGIIVTFYLGIISDKRNESNLKIEQQKHRPILHIAYWDSEDYLKVSIHNKGNGPLIINTCKFINVENNVVEYRIYDCIPDLEKYSYQNYTGIISNVVLKADEEFELFLYEVKDEDNYTILNKTKIRKSLSKYKIVIKYEDVYENVMPLAERNLAWFGRHFE